MNFTLQYLTPEQTQELLRQYDLIEVIFPQMAGLPPEQIAQKFSEDKSTYKYVRKTCFVDKESGAKILRIGVLGENEYIRADRLMLIWHDEPVYIERSYTVFASNQKQVVWKLERIIAHEKLRQANDVSAQELRKVVHEATEQYGFGAGPYKRGPSVFHHTDPDVLFIPDDKNVVTGGWNYYRAKDGSTVQRFSDEELQKRAAEQRAKTVQLAEFMAEFRKNPERVTKQIAEYRKLHDMTMKQRLLHLWPIALIVAVWLVLELTHNI